MSRGLRYLALGERRRGAIAGASESVRLLSLYQGGWRQRSESPTAPNGLAPDRPFACFGDRPVPSLGDGARPTCQLLSPATDAIFVLPSCGPSDGIDLPLWPADITMKDECIFSPYHAS